MVWSSTLFRVVLGSYSLRKPSIKSNQVLTQNMTSALDMSLDELIKSNKQIGRGSAGGRGGKASNWRGATNSAVASSYRGAKAGNAARRQTSRFDARPNPYATAKFGRRVPESNWQRNLVEDSTGVTSFPSSRSSGIETGTKLYISNLDYAVSNDDIKELFSEVGDLKRCAIHYDRSGRSKGTAEVVFSRKADGIAALNRYNNVQLDGKPMNIALVGTNLQARGPSLQRSSKDPLVPRDRTVAMMAISRGHGGRRGGSASYRGRGRGRLTSSGHISKGPLVEKTAEDLDADLEIYHAEAMQTS